MSVDLHIIITGQPLGMTGYWAVVISPVVAFVVIAFLVIICGYVWWWLVRSCSLF